MMMASTNAADVNLTDNLNSQINDQEHLLVENNMDVDLNSNEDNELVNSNQLDNNNLKINSSSDTYSFDDLDGWTSTGNADLSDDNGYDGSYVVLNKASISRDVDWTYVEKIGFWYKIPTRAGSLTVTVGDDNIKKITASNAMDSWDYFEQNVSYTGIQNLKFNAPLNNKPVYIDSLVLTLKPKNNTYSFDDLDGWTSTGNADLSDDNGYDGSYVVLNKASISRDVDWTYVEKIGFWYKIPTRAGSLTVTVGDDNIKKITASNAMDSWDYFEQNVSYTGIQNLKFNAPLNNKPVYIDSLCFTFNYDKTSSDNPPENYTLVADFEYEIRINTGSSATVYFTDKSSGDIVRWIMDYGNGQIYNDTKFPEYNIYSSYGSFDISLTVIDKYGNNNTTTKENILTLYNYKIHTSNVDSFEGDLDGWILYDIASHNYAQSYDGNYSIHVVVNKTSSNLTDLYPIMQKEVDLTDVDSIQAFARTITLSGVGSSSGARIFVYIDGERLGGESNYLSVIHFADWYNHNFDTSSISGVHNVTLMGYLGTGPGIWIDNIKYQNYENIANFTSSVPSVKNGEISITFTDNSYGRISGYYWEFDDGTNTTSRNPTHTFGQGNHSVTLHIYHDGVEVDNCTYEFSLSLPTIAGTGVSYSSVQDAISNASENDVINIDPGMVFVENLVIDKNLTLNFNGAILQSKDSANPVFSVTDGATVIIKDVELNQNSIFATSNDSKLIIRDSDINVNLNLNEGNIDLINNTFNNVGLTLIADTNIYNSTINAGKLTVKGYVIVNDSTISNNCILNVIDDANMILSNSDIIDSKIVSESGNLTVENVTFDNTYLTLTNNCSINNVNIENSGVIVNGGKSKITKSNLTNCNVAITQTAGELELTNNIIKNNNNAINITGGSATISYNAIYHNTGDLTLNGATMNNNWFGTNQVTGYDSYLRLVLTSVDSEMYSGSEYTIKVEFVPNTGSMDGALNDLTLDFTSTNGEVTSPIVISDNQGELKFTAGAVSDEVKFTLLDEEYTLVNGDNPVSIVAKPLDTSLSIESTEKGSIVITLKDSDGNAISGANVNYTINDGKTLSNVTDANGKFTINDLTGLINIVANYTGNKTYNPTNNAKSFDFKLNTGMIIANESKVITITLKDENGKAVVGANVNYTVNGGETLSNVTDANGKFTISDLPDEYIEIKFNYPGDDTYNANVTSMNFNFTVPQKENTTNNTSNATNTTGNGGSTNTNTQTTTTTTAKTVKVASKIVAKKKTFKVKTKTKKYKITLKTKSGKAIKKVKVTLKVKGKTYKAKTNAKGVATFKITKLNKKGKYTAKIKFAGNKSYKATSKKIKLTVKK
ncbi:PKD domain-containing protein [Methanobrevibacter thaueri]|nr:PKD domain-containing protein [Methanobrevibacter thaueri]